MPVSHTKLRPPQKVFTKQDFLDGKCTADGFPIGEAHGSDPETTPSPDPLPTPSAKVKTAENVTSGPDVAVDISIDGDEKVTTTEIDNADSEESEDNADRGDGSGEEVDK